MKKNPLTGLNPHGDKAEILEILEEIAETGVGVNAVGRGGMTPLHFAADLTNSADLISDVDSLVKKMISKGSNIDAKDKAGKLAVDYLVGAKAIRLIGEKLTPETKTDMTKVIFETVGEYVASKEDSLTENPDCLAILESVPDFKEYEGVISGGDKPIHRAAYVGNVTAIKYMHEHGFDMNCKNKDFLQPILIAARNGHVNTVSLLLELGVDPNTKGYQGCSALHEIASATVYRDRDAVVKKLIEAGADAAQPNTAGETPLHMAIAFMNFRGVKLLVKNGVDVNTPDSDGLLPLQMAKDEGASDEMIAYLVENGAREA